MEFRKSLQEIKMEKFSFFIAVLAMVCVTGVAHGATYYMCSSASTCNSGIGSPSGWSTGSDSNPGTSISAPFLTLHGAFSKMAGGDTLIIGNGTYNDGTNDYIQYGQNIPPSGSAGAPTSIIAQNIPCQNGASCSSTLGVIIGPNAQMYMQGYVTSTYVTWKGIYFKSNVCIMGTDHWYFKQCAAEGNKTGNTSVWTSLSATYTLFEDCIAFGMGRYGFLLYDENHLAGDAGYDVCRRCVARLDYMNVVMPTAPFVTYGLTYTAFLNCIAIDGNQPSYWNGTDEIAGAFSFMNVGIASNYGLYSGCIAINNANSLATVPTGSTNASTTQYQNIVGINVGGGFALEGLSTVSNVTAINLNAGNFSGYNTPTDGVNQGFTSLGKGDASVLSGIVVRGAATNVTAESQWAGDYLDYYASGISSFSPAHKYTTDPLVNASGSGGYILYPVRTESGSFLNTTGSVWERLS